MNNNNNNNNNNTIINVKSFWKHFLYFRGTIKRITEAVAQMFSVKKVFLEISQNSQENTCARISLLIKLQVTSATPATLLKKRHWRWRFPVNFAKFLRTPFATEHLRWLLLE